MLPFEKRMSIKSWAEEDRPREKLLQIGRQHLSDAEILAIIIGSGNNRENALDLSRRILKSCGNDLDQLGKYSTGELAKFRGIGKAKSIGIVAALELGRRRRELGRKNKRQIDGSPDVYRFIRPFMEDLEHEEFWMITLNRANRIISGRQVSRGGLSGTVADLRTIFKAALEQLASAVIFCHNHPSGSLKPSEADIELTQKLQDAGELLDIEVLDHLIVSDKDYFSFADEGLL